VVYETGIYNLAQAEAPALVHHGPERGELLLLVRLSTEAAASRD
jgi:hypothetical protein